MTNNRSAKENKKNSALHKHKKKAKSKLSERGIAGRKAEVALDGRSMDLCQRWCGGLGVYACFI